MRYPALLAAIGVFAGSAVALALALRPFTLQVSLPAHTGYEGVTDAVTQATNIESFFVIRLDSLRNPSDPIDSVIIAYNDGVKPRVLTGSRVVMAPDSIVQSHWYVRQDETADVNMCTTKVSAVSRSGLRQDTSIVVRVVRAAYESRAHEGVARNRPAQLAARRAASSFVPAIAIRAGDARLDLKGRISPNGPQDPSACR